MAVVSSRFRSLWLAFALVLVATPAAFAQGKPESKGRTQVVELPTVQRSWTYGRPIIRIGQDYTLKAGDTVRDIRSVLADVHIDGHVDHDVVVVAGNATLSSTAVIDGSLVVIAGSATIASGAVVDHDLVVVGGTADTAADFRPRGDHVIVGTPWIGSWLREIVPWLTRGLLVGRLIVPDLRWVWAFVGMGLLVGLLMNHIFNRQVSATAAALTQRPITAFFMGLLVLLLAGPILALVAASVIGLAIVPFAIAAMFVATLIGKIGVARVLGRSIIAETEPENRAQSLRSYLLGAVIITIAYMIPVLGIVTWALVGVFGLGCATMSFAATLRRERPARPPKPTKASSVDEPPPAPPVPEAPPPFVPPPVPPSTPAFGAPGASAQAVDLALYPRASFLDRTAALALDVVLMAIVNAVLRYPWNDGGFLVVVLAYQIGFMAWRGTTLGGVICGLRVVRANGAELRFVDAVVRELSSVFSIAALGIGCLVMLNDPERQTWHDKIAGTVVVKMPREMVLA
jgi:uncharacterized RDD family membrane protein YckC